jgi:hypothetical protein
MKTDSELLHHHEHVPKSPAPKKLSETIEVEAQARSATAMKSRYLENCFGSELKDRHEKMNTEVKRRHPIQCQF